MACRRTGLIASLGEKHGNIYRINDLAIGTLVPLTFPGTRETLCTSKELPNAPHVPAADNRCRDRPRSQESPKRISRARFPSAERRFQMFAVIVLTLCFMVFIGRLEDYLRHQSHSGLVEITIERLLHRIWRPRKSRLLHHPSPKHLRNYL